MPKRVKGPTDHVVVVGAGLAGLSTALRLAGAGRKVTVIERESVPGGRNGLLNKDGYAFDTGPSVLTMPSLINDAFNSVGEELEDWLDLFHPQSLIELDYGGLANYLDKALRESGESGLDADTSIEDVLSSLAGLAAGDGSLAGQGYERLVSRWRKVAAYESAM